MEVCLWPSPHFLRGCSGARAQAVNHLPLTPENLSLTDPLEPMGVGGVRYMPLISDLWKGRQEEPGGSLASQPVSISELQVQGETVSHTKVKDD